MATVSAGAMQWHKVSLDFQSTSSFLEEASTFRDYRLDVELKNTSTGEVYTVPGYFAADGNASETGATSGQTWRVNFNPPSEGEWTYTASFRTGNDIAALSYDAAQQIGRVEPIDNGATGSFTVAETDKAGESFHAKGMILQDDGTHYLQHQGDGDYFIRGGPGVPENLLATADFDGWRRGFASSEDASPGTDDKENVARHQFSNHRGDFNGAFTDLWATDDENASNGQAIFGAVDYLASKGQNTIYLLTNTIGGDGRDVGPWVGNKIYSVGTNKNGISHAGLTAADVSTYDVSKLEQWERLFDYMDERNIYKNVLFQETENEKFLNGGTADPEGSSLSVERKIYMREMIARFGHNNGIQWNLGEENDDQTHRERADMAAWTKDVDPYDHLVVIHTYGGAHNTIYSPLLDDKAFDGPSFQTGAGSIRNKTIEWREKSAADGDPWVIAWDEDSGPNADVSAGNTNPDETRALREGFWGHLTAGGSGGNWYLKGNGFGGHSFDQNLDDFRPFEVIWDWTDAATSFFNTYVPFWNMTTDDGLTTNGGDFVLAHEGQYYVVYLRYGQADDVALDLRGHAAERFDAYWYDPRNGGPLIEIGKINGGGVIDFDNPPSAAGKDWVLFVRNEDLPDAPESVPPSDDPKIPDDPSDPRDDLDITLMLIDPSTDTSLGELMNGATIDLSRFESNITVEAVASASGVGSAVFSVNGEVTQTENFAPYALFGDTNGDFNGGSFTPGTYTLAVDAFSGSNGSGTFLGSANIEVEVIEGGDPPTDPDPGNPDPTPVGGAYIEDGGLVVIEMESADALPSSWRDRSSSNSPDINRPGVAAGDNFIVWEGKQFFGTPGNAQITYQVAITTPGLYTFDWHNQVGRGGNATEHNDTWLKIDADAFYGVKGGQTVYPKGGDRADNDYPAKSKVPNGSGADGWFKVYAAGANDWKWSARTSDHEGFEIVARFDEPGTYDIHISARSSAHAIDRMILVNEDVYSGNARNLSLPQSERVDDKTPPPNTSPEAFNDAATTSAGQAVVVNVLANDSDADGDGLSLEAVDAPANGTATIVSGGVRYVPDAGFSGRDTVDYTISDGEGGTDQATLTIDVAAPPMPPEPEFDPGKVSFRLIDGATGKVIDAELAYGETVDAIVLPDTYEIQALGLGGTPVDSILTTFGGHQRLENHAPYTVFVSSQHGDEVMSGAQSFTLDFFSENGAKGENLGQRDFLFEIASEAPVFDASVLSYQLVDGVSGAVVDADLTHGEAVRLDSLPDNIKVRALGVDGAVVESIRILDGEGGTRIEDRAPWTIFKSATDDLEGGDTVDLALSFHSADGARGERLATADFSFTIVSEEPAPTSPTTGGPGDDVLPGTAGDDVITTGGGEDTVVYSGGSDLIVDFMVGDDTLELEFNNETRRVSTREEFLDLVEDLESSIVRIADAYVKDDNLVLEPTNGQWIELEDFVNVIGRASLIDAGADIL